MSASIGDLIVEYDGVGADSVLYGLHQARIYCRGLSMTPTL